MARRLFKNSVDSPEIIPSSALKYSWEKAKPWLLAREFMYALAITAITAAVHYYSHTSHKHHSIGASLDYLWTFLASAGGLLVIQFLWSLATHPWKVHVQTFQQHMSDHTRADSLGSRLGVVETTLASLGTSVTDLRTTVAGINSIHVTVQEGATINQHFGAGSNAEAAQEIEEHEALDPGVDT